jgi:type VI secretion system secreted protein VgrG
MEAAAETTGKSTATHSSVSIPKPHIGSEVIVDFLEGDPDRPVITGRVYHGENTVPKGLEDTGNKHLSIIRDDFGHEIVMDATPGDEHIRLFSPKKGHEASLEIGNSFKIDTSSDSSKTWGGNHYDAGIGHKFAAYTGSNFIAQTGLYGKLELAAKMTATVGFDMGIMIGPKWSKHIGRDISSSSKSKLSFANEDHVLSAKETMNIVGGAGGTRTTSIIEAAERMLSLTIGPNEDPPPRSYDRRKKGRGGSQEHRDA